MGHPLRADILLGDGPWTETHSWSARDTAIYNLGIGFGHAAIDDPRLLSYVTEEAAIAFPTMAGAVNMDSNPLFRPAYGIDLAGMLHGEEAIEILRPLPAAANIVTTIEIENLWDRGAEHGAILRMRRTLADAVDGATLAVVRSTLMLRSNGGFGGSAEGSPRALPNPQRPPDGAATAVTRPEQALLYRLTGDRNPLHSDPEVAFRAGFARPILMGLCSFGIIARMLTTALVEGDGSRMRMFSVRFADVVYPGDTLQIAWWRLNEGSYAFEARVAERDALVLSGGRVRFD